MNIIYFKSNFLLKKLIYVSQVWCGTHVTQFLERWRQEDFEFKALSRPCLKNKIQTKGLGAWLKW
jgi:hypothetical protein